jgi:hypothetical protein
MDGQMSLNQFVAAYRHEYRFTFHRALRPPGGIALKELGYTLSDIQTKIPPADIQAYIGFALKWARAKGISPSHRLLRSPKLMEGYLYKAGRAAKKFLPVDALRQTYETPPSKGTHGAYQAEFCKFVGIVNTYLKRGDTLIDAFSNALEARQWTYEARLRRLCQGHLQHKDRFSQTLSRFGEVLHDPSSAE